MFFFPSQNTKNKPSLANSVLFFFFVKAIKSTVFRNWWINARIVFEVQNAPYKRPTEAKQQNKQKNTTQNVSLAQEEDGQYLVQQIFL